MRKVLIQNTLIYSFSEFFPKALSIIFLPIFTRHLSPEDYGVWHYTNSVIAFLLAISILSLHTFVLRHYWNLKTGVERKKLIGNLSIFVFFFNTLIFALSLAVFPKIISLLNIKVSFFPYFFLALTANYFNVFAIIPLVICRTREDSKKFALLNISKAALITGVSFLLIMKYKAGILSFYYSNLGVNIAFCAIYFVITYKNSIFSINYTQLKQAVKFSLPLVPSSVSFLIIDLIDRVLLERFVNLAQIGIYSIAYTLGFSVNIFIHGAYQAFEPRLFKNFASPDFYNYFYFLKKHYFAITVFISFSVAVFSKEILVLFTAERFHSGAGIVPLIILAAVLKSEYIIYGVALMAEKRTKHIAALTTMGALINIALNLLLLPVLGIWGAAVSTVASFFAMSVAVYVFSKKLQNITIILKELIILLVCSGIILSFSGLSSDVSFMGSILLKVLSIMFLLLVIQVYYLDYLPLLKDILYFKKRGKN